MVSSKLAESKLTVGGAMGFPETMTEPPGVSANGSSERGAADKEASKGTARAEPAITQRAAKTATRETENFIVKL